MRPTFRLSSHAVEKHLDVYNTNASVFYSKNIMCKCIAECIKKPDIQRYYNKRYEVTKTFTYNIGMLASTDTPSNKVKVIFTTTKRSTFVITAFPIV